MKKTNQYFLQVFFSFLSMLFLSSLIRVVFFLWNRNHYNTDLTQHSFFSLFFSGFNYDLLSLFIINTPFLLIASGFLIKKRGEFYKKIGSLFFIIPNAIYILWNIIDVKAFHYSSERITFSVFYSFLKDIIEQNFYIYYSIQHWHYFFPVTVFFFGFLWLFYWLGDVDTKAITPYRNKLKFLIPFTILFFSVTFFIGLKNSENIKIPSAFVLNSFAYSVYDKFFKKDIYSKMKLLNPAEAISNVQYKGTNFQEKKVHDNIIIIVLESMNIEFLNTEYTPFLSSLSKKSFYFPNHFSNVRSSFKALANILLGTPYIDFDDIDKKWEGLGTLLAREGYHSFFFSPGSKNSMMWDKVNVTAGIQNHIAKEDFLKKYPKSPISQWGVYDEAFFHFTIDKLSNHFKISNQKPFLSLIFTIQSHAPYDIPEKDRKRLQFIESKILRSIRYIDDSLKSFFKSAQTKKWYKNTLFILTADHTQPPVLKNIYETALGRHRVPLILFHPNKKITPYTSQKLTQHSDIYPTILSYLGLIQKNKQYFGRSVLDSISKGRVFLKEDNSFILVEGKYAYYYYISEEKAQLFQWKDFLRQNPLKNKLLTKKYEKLTKSYIKYYELKHKALKKNNPP